MIAHERERVPDPARWFPEPILWDGTRRKKKARCLREKTGSKQIHYDKQVLTEVPLYVLKVFWIIQSVKSVLQFGYSLNQPFSRVRGDIILDLRLIMMCKHRERDVKDQRNNC